MVVKKEGEKMNTYLKNKKSTFIRLGILLVILPVIIIFRHPLSNLWHFLQDQGAVSDYLQSLGMGGPLMLFLLLLAQVFIAFIPGHALMLTGGYVYGGLVAVMIVIASTVLGSQLAFTLARRYGRQLIYRLAVPEIINRWDRMAAHQGGIFFFFAFVLPIFPSDLMCYVAGLGTVSPRSFFFANLFGRSLCAVALTLIGAFGFHPPLWFLLLAIACILTFFIAWWIFKKHNVQLNMKNSLSRG